MSSVLLLWRAQWRSSWRSLVALILIVALGTAVSLAAIAGARRTNGAIDVLYDTFNAADVDSGGIGRHDPVEALAQVRRYDGIDDLSIESIFLAVLPEETGIRLQDMRGSRTDGDAVNVAIVRRGRLPEAEDEIALNRDAQRRTALGLGDTLEIVIADASFEEFFEFEFEVVGVIDRIEEIVQDEAQLKPFMLVSDEFVDAHLDLIMFGSIQATTEPGKKAALQAQLVAAGLLPQQFADSRAAQLKESVRIVVVTLGALGMLSAAATIIVGSQLLVRIARRPESDTRSLLAIGTTPRQQTAGDSLLAASVAAAGMLFGVGLAVAISPLFPVGSIRRVPGITGVDVDIATLAIGAPVLAIAFTIVMVASASLERGRAAHRPSVGFTPSLAKLSPAIGTGIQFATSRRGSSLVVISSAIGMTIAIATLTFIGSLGRLVDDPSRSGFVWDLASRDSFAEIDTMSVSQVVGELPDVEQVTGVYYSTMAIEGAPVAASVVWPIKGSEWPSVQEGRTPMAPFEILAGRAMMRRFNLELDDTVTVQDSDTDASGNRVTFTHTFVIVGEMISPAIGVASQQTPRLDEGFMVHIDDVDVTGWYGGADILLFDLADGVDPVAFHEQYFAEGLEDENDIATDWFTSADPSEVVEAASARPTLILGVATLSAVVVATVLHGIIGFVREHGRAFVVLSAIGFTPRQIRTVVRSQGLVLISTALLVAIPVGVGVGRWLWMLFANDIGVVPEPDVPWLAILASVVGLLVISHTALALPARRAQRVRVAETHRAT